MSGKLKKLLADGMDALAIYNPTQAVAYLNHIVSIHTLAHYRMRGLPPRWSKLNGKIVYRKEHLDEWVVDSEQPLTMTPNLPPQADVVELIAPADVPVDPPKRKRGRPRKAVAA